MWVLIQSVLVNGILDERGEKRKINCKGQSILQESIGKQFSFFFSKES